MTAHDGVRVRLAPGPRVIATVSEMFAIPQPPALCEQAEISKTQVSTAFHIAPMSYIPEKIENVRPRRPLRTAPGRGHPWVRGLTVIDGIEEWRPVVGFEGSYEVSSCGRVRSVDRWVPQKGKKSRFYKGQARAIHLVKGYPHTGLKRHGVLKNVYVHTLMCEAFYGPRPSPAHETRHLNGNPTDNRIENLLWGTKAENAQDVIRHGHHAGRNKTRCKRDHPFDKTTAAGTRYCSVCATANRRRYELTTDRVERSRKHRERREIRAAAEGRTLRKRQRTALWQPEEKAS